jgi:hypothetical protein
MKREEETRIGNLENECVEKKAEQVPYEDWTKKKKFRVKIPK